MVRSITLNHITKIEGHAKLNLGIDKGKVTTCELSATEGSRYFEGIVKGRKYFEAHEITSRICGICSCAHVVAALTAIEDALGIQISEQARDLRILITLGERIRSHATHLYFLALPDYLGCESALAMAPRYKKELQNALQLMKAGNSLIQMLGARDIHPVSATPGGWLKTPSKGQIDEAKERLFGAMPSAIKTCELFFSFPAPAFESSSDWFSLSNKDEYAVLDGNFCSAKNSFERHRYRDFLKEFHEERSTANFVTKQGKRYMVGALARLNNNSAQLLPKAKSILFKSKISLPCRNPYLQNSAQAIEIVHCIEHAISILERLDGRPMDIPPITPRAGRGVGAIEVPRGTLWHEYELDGTGTITYANIITPTAQNLLSIQEDIREIVPSLLSRSPQKEELILSIEKLIRSYDPCFSCSAHFLEVNWEEAKRNGTRVSGKTDKNQNYRKQH